MEGWKRNTKKPIGVRETFLHQESYCGLWMNKGSKPTRLDGTRLQIWPGPCSQSSTPCLHLPRGTLLVLTAGEATVAKSVTFRIHFDEAVFGGSFCFCNVRHLRKERSWGNLTQSWKHSLRLLPHLQELPAHLQASAFHTQRVCPTLHTQQRYAKSQLSLYMKVWTQVLKFYNKYH